MRKDPNKSNNEQSQHDKELQDKITELMGPEPEMAPPTNSPVQPPQSGSVISPTEPPPSAPEVPAAGSTEEISAPEPKEAPSPAAPEAVAEPPQPDPVVQPPVADSSVLSDPKTAQAVDEIIAQDSDALLQAEDEKIAEAFLPQPKLTLGGKIKRFFVRWWQSKRARWATILLLLLALAAAVAIPTSRYFILNTAGVRSSARVEIIDASTLQPLKNVSITLSDGSAKTDEDGRAVLNNIRLGQTELVVERRGFATIRQKMVVGWGSNPLGERQLTPTGTQYTFRVTDFLSDKPLAKIEAYSGEASAYSDAEGKLVLTLDKDDEATEAVITGEGIREETVALPDDPSEVVQVPIVPWVKHAFVSKRSGSYDLYKIDADGANEELVLRGTGNERYEDMLLISHPTDNKVAYVATRSGDRNGDGYLLSDLVIVDLVDNSVTEVTQSEQIRLIDWVGDRLIYVKVAEGASAANPERTQLMAYHYKDETNKVIAASNYLYDVQVAGEAVYYAPALAYHGSGDIGFYRINPDGTGKTAILESEVWSVSRLQHDAVAIQGRDGWFEYTIGGSKAVKSEGEPVGLRSTVYVDSPDRTKSLWVDERDGKGVLLVYTVSTREDAVLQTLPGLRDPALWLNNSTAVYRVSTISETADYVVSLDGGEPRKLSDVTDVSGTQKWRY